MLTNIAQIQNVEDIFVLKECWQTPCGLGSNQQIINNRWYIPVTYCAEKCSMNVVTLLEEHLFASGLNVNFLGHMAFLQENANLKQYSLNGIVCSTLRYKDGSIVYADITKLPNREK